MITIQYARKRHSLRIKGHAGFANIGQDIICASVSMVFYNLAQVLMDYDKDTMARPVKMRFGDVSLIEATPKDAVRAWVDHDFYFAMRGFSMLAEQYPEYVNVVVTEK